MNLTINKALLEKVPDFDIIAYDISFNDSYYSLTKTQEVDELIKDTSEFLLSKYNYDEVTQIEKIKYTRDVYKKLGKDPSHTRPACEALLRRILKGNTLYRLGDVIDLGNVLSLLTNKSVCVVDYNKLKGDVFITIGTKEDSYQGINRDIINMDKMIIYKDSVGPFGSPTSDTNRTVVDEFTKRILVMIICPNNIDMDKDESLLIDIFNKYSNIKNMTKINTRK